MKKYLKGGLIVGLPVLAVVFYQFDPGKQELFPRCLFYSATGYFCPGCGSQRAIHSLLHWNLAGVANSNFLFFPAILLIGYHYTQKALNQRFHLNLPNVLYYKNTPWIIFSVILLFWVVRNLPFLPFSLLAPH